MNDKILAAIEESLPQMQVTAIRKALMELEQLRAANKELESEKKSYSTMWHDERDTANSLNQELSKTKEQLEKVIASNVELMAKDVDARVKLAEGKLESVNTTVDKFLKNTIYRESLQHEIIEENRGSNYQYGPNGQQQLTPYTNKTAKPVTDKRERTTE